MRVIGLTGGIASGKSTVAALIRRAGFSVIDADQVAREVVAPGSPILAQIAAQFGAEVLRADGSLDRHTLAQRVFGNPKELQRLNGLIHPAILASIQKKRASLEAQGESLVFLEVPLLYETGIDKWCESVIAVRANPEVQLARLRQRGLGEAEAKARLEAQWADEKKATLARYVIDNSGHILQTESQLRAIINTLTQVN